MNQVINAQPEHLEGYLERLAGGDETARPLFYEAFAKSMVHVPATVRENDHIVRCAISLIEEYAKPTIPVFVSTSEVALWKKTSNRDKDTVFTILGADLCSSLDLATQIVVSPGSESTVIIGPDQIDSIASTPFDPPLAATNSAAAAAPEAEEVEVEEEAVEERTGFGDLTLADEDEAPEPIHRLLRERSLTDDDVIAEEPPHAAVAEAVVEEIDSGDDWIRPERLIEATDGEARPSAAMFTEEVDDDPFAGAVENQPQEILSARRAPDTMVYTPETSIDSESSGDDTTVIFETSDDPDELLEVNEETATKVQPAVDNGATQFLRPLKRGGDSIQERFVRQPRRRFGDTQ